MGDPFHSALRLLSKTAEVHGGLQNNKGQQTSHRPDGGLLPILVLSGPFDVVRPRNAGRAE